MELGETSGLMPSAEPQLGQLKVKVVSKGRGRWIEETAVTLSVDRSGRTGSDGTLTFKKLRPDTYDVQALRRYPEQDYITFVVHYPAITVTHKAIGRRHQSVEVDGNVSLTLKIDYYRPLPGVTIRRNHIILFPTGPDDDQFGHWWIEIDAESYGWWPKYRPGSSKNRGPKPKPPAPLPPNTGRRAQIQHKFAMLVYNARLKLYYLRESRPAQTFFGVEGELNGVTSFDGRETEDPHARIEDTGHESYQVIITDEEDIVQIKKDLLAFARRYTGSWSWRFEFGQNCHTFQVEMLRAAGLRRFRRM